MGERTKAALRQRARDRFPMTTLDNDHVPSVGGLPSCVRPLVQISCARIDDSQTKPT